MEAARQIFGKQVALLPEAASIVYSGGFPRLPSPHSVRAAQRAIAKVQIELETFVSEDRTAPVVLCDRAIADGAAYWPEGADAFFDSIGISRELVFARYSTVIHLRTPTLAMGYDNSNPMRTETAEEAALLDRKIETVWRGHPNRLVVPATETFTEKLDQVKALIHAELLLQTLPSSSTKTEIALSTHDFLN
jgi:hypothetical protein